MLKIHLCMSQNTSEECNFVDTRFKTWNDYDMPLATSLTTTAKKRELWVQKWSSKRKRKTKQDLYLAQLCHYDKLWLVKVGLETPTHTSEFSKLQTLWVFPAVRVILRDKRRYWNV